MTVPVRVSGAGPFQFLVDTGADRTAVSRELAGKTGPRERRHCFGFHTVTGQTGRERLQWCHDLQLTRRPVKVGRRARFSRARNRVPTE